MELFTRPLQEETQRDNNNKIWTSCKEEKKVMATAGPGGVPVGAQTQEYYRTQDIPARFDNPGSYQTQKIVNNPGNPVASCSYPPEIVPPKIEEKHGLGSDWFQGYGGKPQHPMYTTSANKYGGKPPSVHTMPTQFYAKSQKFSEHLGTCGMYRNFSLNTEVDKSKV